MSSPETALQEIILEDQLWLLGNYAIVSSLCLWVVDFFQTLPMEIEAVWFSKLTVPKILFLANRYGYGAFIGLELIFVVPTSTTYRVCGALTWTGEILDSLTTVTSTLLLGLRAYVLSGRSKFLLVVILTGALMRTALNFWEYNISYGSSTQGSQFESFSMCGVQIKDNDGYERCTSLSFRTIFTSLAFDSFVFGVTVIKTYRHSTEMRRLGQKSITQLLLRDGIFYYAVITMITCANATLNIISVSHNVSQYWSLLADLMTPFWLVLTNILTNHLFLNIRAQGHPQANRSHRSLNIPEPVFAQNGLLGALEGPVEHGWLEAQFDEDDSEDMEDVAVSRLRDPTVTLVPVVYGNGEEDRIEMLPIRRAATETDPSAASGSGRIV